MSFSSSNNDIYIVGTFSELMLQLQLFNKCSLHRTSNLDLSPDTKTKQYRNQGERAVKQHTWFLVEVDLFICIDMRELEPKILRHVIRESSVQGQLITGIALK